VHYLKLFARLTRTIRIWQLKSAATFEELRDPENYEDSKREIADATSLASLIFIEDLADK